MLEHAVIVADQVCIEGRGRGWVRGVIYIRHRLGGI